MRRKRILTIRRICCDYSNFARGIFSLRSIRSSLDEDGNDKPDLRTLAQPEALWKPSYAV